MKKEYWHNRYRDKKAQGICGGCTTRPVIPGKSKCEQCAEYGREYYRKNKTRLIAHQAALRKEFKQWKESRK